MDVGAMSKSGYCVGNYQNNGLAIKKYMADARERNVNVESIGELKDAMGMFSGKDQGIILKAISTYRFERGFVKAAEDEEEETVEKISAE